MDECFENDCELQVALGTGASGKTDAQQVEPTCCPWYEQTFSNVAASRQLCASWFYFDLIDQKAVLKSMDLVEQEAR